MQCTKVCKIQFAMQYAVDDICNNRELVDTINTGLGLGRRRLLSSHDWRHLPKALRLRAPKQQMLDAAKYK